MTILIKTTFHCAATFRGQVYLPAVFILFTDKILIAINARYVKTEKLE